MAALLICLCIFYPSYIATLYVFVAMWNMWHLLYQGVDEDIEDEPVLRSGDLSFVIFYVEGGK